MTAKDGRALQRPGENDRKVAPAVYAAALCLILAGAAGFLAMMEWQTGADADAPHALAAVSHAPWILAGTGGTAFGLIVIAAALSAPRTKKRPSEPTIDLLRSPYGRVEDTGVWPPSPPRWYNAKLRPGTVRQKTLNGNRIRALRAEREPHARVARLPEDPGRFR